MDAKYRRNRKMSEKINAKSINQQSSKQVNQKETNFEVDEGGDVRFLPMSRFNFLKKYFLLISVLICFRARSVKPESIEDSGVSMDSDLSKSMDQLKAPKRKSFSLAKTFLQAEDPPDEDDDIVPTSTDLRKIP